MHESVDPSRCPACRPTLAVLQPVWNQGKHRYLLTRADQHRLDQLEAEHEAAEQRRIDRAAEFEDGLVAAREARRRSRELQLATMQRRRARKREAPVNDLTAAQWRSILERWDNRCAYCGDASVPLTQDHVQALVEGGDHTAANIVPACRSCNGRKGRRPAPPFVVMPREAD